MDHPGFMGSMEGQSHFTDQGHAGLDKGSFVDAREVDVAGGELRTSRLQGDLAAEVMAGDQLHRDPVILLLAPEGIDRGDAWMAELASHHGLPADAAALRLAQARDPIPWDGGPHLEGHASV